MYQQNTFINKYLETAVSIVAVITKCTLQCQADKELLIDGGFYTFRSILNHWLIV